MKILEKIGQVCLAATSVTGTAAIGYLVYRGVRDILNVPNNVMELCGVYQDGVNDGIKDGYRGGYDDGFVDAAMGHGYHGDDEELRNRFNKPVDGDKILEELFSKDAKEGDATAGPSADEAGEGDFSLKNAFNDQSEAGGA